MALPTAQPIGNQPFSNPVMDDELWRNLLFDLGLPAATTPTERRGILRNLDLSLFTRLAQASQEMTLAPSGAIAAPYPRFLVNDVTIANQDTILQLVAVWLPQNYPVNGLNWFVGTTGDAAPTNHWMVLLNSARVVVAASADKLTAAITASTTTAPVTVNYPVATIAAGAGAQYVTSTAGIYYIGLAINGSATALASGFASSLEAVNLAPKLAGTSTVSQTTPLAVGGAAQTAITGVAAVPYFFLN